MYKAEPGYIVWAGVTSESLSSPGSVYSLTVTIKALTGNFDGDYGETRTFNLKAIVGAKRNNIWYSDDPEGIFDFAAVTGAPYQSTIVITKVEDTTAPDPIGNLTTSISYDGVPSVTVEWPEYNADIQGDVVAYRVYRSMNNFSNVSGMTPVYTLPPNNLYYVDMDVVSGNEYFYAVTAIDELDQENKVVTPISVYVPIPGFIQGTVYSNSQPIIGKNIYIYSYSGTACSMNQYKSTFVDPLTGNFSIGLLPGTYYLQTSTDENFLNEWWSEPESVQNCDGAESIEIGEGENKSGKNFQLDPGATVSGTLYESDGVTPITGKSMYVYAYQGDPCGSRSSYGSASINLTDGTYAITRLPSGNYYLYAYPSSSDVNYQPEWWAAPISTTNCAGAQGIAVSAGQNITDKNFQLDPGATISGTLYESDGVTPITGKSMYVYAYQGDPCGSRSFYGSASINLTDGTYAITRLPTGNYFLQANSSSDVNYQPEWWADPLSTPNCAGAQGIAASAGQNITSKNFQMDPGATISGTLFESDGVTPITGPGSLGTFLDVQAYQGDPCGSRSSYGSASINLTDGTYTITRLPSGNYYLYAYPSNSNANYVSEWWADPSSTPNCSGAKVIVVSPGQKITGKNFQLEENVSVKKGDVNNDGNVDLTDLILVLRLLSGDGTVLVDIRADVNDDGKIGNAECIYIMQQVVGI
ncbi:MAG: dockerin type I domain-containing protein [Desulfatirhabdiaceae bacterium]